MLVRPRVAPISERQLAEAYRRHRPARDAAAWRQLAAVWGDRHGASIDGDAIVLALSPFRMLRARHAALILHEARALHGKQGRQVVAAVTRARARIAARTLLPPALVSLSPKAIAFEQEASTLEAWLRDLGQLAASAEPQGARWRPTMVLGAAAGWARRWIKTASPRRRDFWPDGVRLLAYQAWNEPALVGRAALRVSVAELAFPPRDGAPNDPQLEREGQRLRLLSKRYWQRRR